MPSSNVIQQLFNVLQAANVQAVKFDVDGGSPRPLITSLLLANGATGDGKPLPPPPHDYVGDYLVLYTAPGGETALLTRAQAEVVMEFWDLPKAKEGRHGLVTGTTPVGCCTDKDGGAKNNVPISQCICPPNQSWSQSPCGGWGDGRHKRGVVSGPAAVEKAHDE